MRLGKLPPDVLERLLAQLPHVDARVAVGPRPGEDAAVIAIGDARLVVTTDPITFVSARSAWYALQVNANDIAAMGTEPSWLALTALFPPETNERQLDALFSQLRTACLELGIEIVTGHTEVTDAVVRPVLVGTMLGLAPPEGAIGSGGAKVGDVLIVAGAAAVEGTAALAAEAGAALSAAGLTAEQIAEAAALIDDPGISVLAASRSLRSACRPHALHDATEGGIATAIRELAEASHLGVRVWLGEVPLLPITRTLCAALGLDPFGLLSSGCLLAAVAAEDVGDALRQLRHDGISAAKAGGFTPPGPLLALTERDAQSLPAFDRDEIARWFEAQPR
ncbi:MAG TPA: AIR synthase related protein [Dehalococcoidia bacterium]|nr:AIR synthase related protein [Dehalococcoidia bacterium]